MTQPELAELVGVKTPSVSRYEREDDRLTLPLLRRIAEALSCAVPDLTEDTSFEPGDAAVTLSEVIPYDHGEALEGSGERGPIRARVWSFDRSYINEISRQGAELRIAKANGDAMEPTIFQNERVIVDTTDKDISGGGVFCLIYGGHVQIRRLQASSEPGKVRVISDNKAYDPEDVSPDRLKVIGRVIRALHSV